MRVLLTLAYDGTGYAGWQRQAGAVTVQQRLEEACAAVLGCRVQVEGAGRTDAGVHALAQCAHFDLPRRFPVVRLPAALNANLPEDIAVRHAQAVPAEFHARFSARGKRYAYRFVTCPVRPVLARGFFRWERRRLDVAAMRQGAAALRGRHDFAAFANNPGYTRRGGTIRRIDHLHLFRRPHGVDLVVQGDGFLYNMVRNIAGTLRMVGIGKLPAAAVAAILAGRDRAGSGPTLPAAGLCLVRVLYPRRSVSTSVSLPRRPTE